MGIAYAITICPELTILDLKSGYIVIGTLLL